MKEFTRYLRVFILLSFITGVVYPMVIIGVSALGFRQKSRGNLIVYKGQVAGSSLIGQEFTSARYFHGRPSALERVYDARNSQGSNWGPSNKIFLQTVNERVRKIREENGLEPLAPVPADSVLASGSGLDPHISLAAAMIQIKRVARERGVLESVVKELMQKHIETPFLGFLGQDSVNVLQLNLSLDKML